MNSEHYFTNLNLGAIHEERDEDEKALAYFERALELNYHFRVLFNLGVLAGKADLWRKRLPITRSRSN